jgi:thiamine biosynthesis lipoprotein
MKKTIFISMCIGFLACNPKILAYKTLEGNAQGTTFKITFKDTIEKDITVQIDSLFKVIDQSMSLWDSLSLISKINNNAIYDSLDFHFLKVFEASRLINQKSEGYFDVSVGPLVKAWGFSIKKGLPIPTSLQIDSLNSIVGSDKFQLVEQKIRKEDPRNQIDFNAIAQGYTVDVISVFLEDLGCKDYLVEIGGELRAKGKNKEGKVWRVGIEKPQNERALEVVVNLENKSLATSGSYRKFFEKDGKKYSHAIDPKTGYPVTHSVLSMSVLANDCMTADAYATAFLVMGLEKAKRIAAKEKLDFFAIYDENGKSKVFSTKGFAGTVSK